MWGIRAYVASQVSNCISNITDLNGIVMANLILHRQVVALSVRSFRVIVLALKSYTSWFDRGRR